MRFGKTAYDPDTLFIPDSPWKSRDFDAEDMLNKLIAELAHSFHRKHTKLGNEGSTDYWQDYLYKKNLEKIGKNMVMMNTMLKEL